MTTHFNNQEFVDRFSKGLTTINKRTTERNIAIGTAVVFGVIIVGYTVYRLQNQSTEHTLTKASAAPVSKQSGATNNQQQATMALSENLSVQNNDGLTRYAPPILDKITG